MTWRLAVIALGVLLLLPIVVFAALSLFSRRPTNLGVSSGRLAPCPSSPNCVCTHDSDDQHSIAPLEYGGTAEEARERLRRVLGSQPQAQIVSSTPDYVHVEFSSRLFRFVDDVEFQFDDGARLIHFRSASRAGHSDLGVNRRRMESIRAAYVAQGG